MSIPKGSTVLQITTPITGVVVKTQFNESLDCLEYLVEYVNSVGEKHSRWFLESQITEVAAPITAGV